MLDVLYDPESPANLVSVSQVSEAGGKSHFEAGGDFVSFPISENVDIRLKLEMVNGVYAFVTPPERDYDC